MKDQSTECDLGGLIRRRRAELSMSASDVARTTSVQRTYVHDCEAGRKFPSRTWMERFVDIQPADPTLLEIYEREVAARTEATRRPFGRLASLLAKEIQTALNGNCNGDAPPDEEKIPETFQALASRTECVATALRLIRPEPEGSPGPGRSQPFGNMIFVHAPSLESPEIPWIDAMRFALGRGQTVVHVIALDHGPDRRIQRVRELLPFLARCSGQYIPVVRPAGSAAPMELVVAPGRGVLQLMSAGTAASFFPWQEPYIHACVNLTRDAHAIQLASHQVLAVLDAECPPGQRKPPPPPNNDFRGWLKRLPPKVVFESEMTQATMRGGRRVLIKGGLTLATMPPHTTQELAAHLRQRACEYEREDLVPLIDTIVSNRANRWHDLVTNETDPFQHVCSKVAIRAYLHGQAGETDEWVYQHDPLFSGEELSKEARVAHVKRVADLLRTASSYEMALVESGDDLPIPTGASYWYGTADALFHVGCRKDEYGPRYAAVRERSVADAFYQTFDGVWESIPAEWRDRRRVADWLDAEARSVEAL